MKTSTYVQCCYVWRNIKWWSVCSVFPRRGERRFVFLWISFYFNFILRYLFLYPTESGSPESRVNAVHFLVHKLPEKNKEMLEILVKHLAKWVLWPAFLPCQNSCLYLSLTTKGFSEVWLELKPILMLLSSTPRTKQAKADKTFNSRCAYFGGKGRNLRH